MRKFISHMICGEDPGWPGNPTAKLENFSVIKEGDVANTYVLTLFNHFGTHMDAPKHYNDAGENISGIPKEFFFYDRPLLLDIPKGALEKINPEDLKPYEDKLRQCDCLMLRTGFETQRKLDPDTYSKRGPAVSAACAKYLMENFCGQIKAVAVDFVSLACPADTVDGDEAHHHLLGMYTDGYICIIEDVSMVDLPAGMLKSAAAIPLFVEGMDSSPVTMWVDL